MKSRITVDKDSKKRLKIGGDNNFLELMLVFTLALPFGVLIVMLIMMNLGVI